MESMRATCTFPTQKCPSGRQAGEGEAALLLSGTVGSAGSAVVEAWVLTGCRRLSSKWRWAPAVEVLEGEGGSA